MAVLLPVPLDNPAVSLFRPHDPAGYWSTSMDGTRIGYGVRWHASQNGGDVQMHETALRALVKSAASALGMSIVEFAAPVAEIDCETVPVAICGLPEFAEPTTAVEPKTEAWRT